MDDSSTVISTEVGEFNVLLLCTANFDVCLFDEQIKMFNKSSMDVSILDLIVLATVQRLTVFVVFKFVNRVMVSGYGFHPIRAQ